MKIIKKLLPIIGLLYFGLTCFGASPRGVSYDPSNTNVLQTVHQKFHSITNLAGTAGETTILNAEKKMVTTNAAGMRGLISAAGSATTITIDGTAGEVSSSAGAQSLAANRTWTLSLPSVLDFGGKVLEIPNGAAPTTDATGEFALDTTITDHAPMLQYFSGATEYLVISIPRANLDTTDGDVIKYDAATDRFVMAPDNNDGEGGSAPVGTMVNSGASTQYAIPYYNDATGTNMVPSLITTDATKTNLNSGGLNANVLTLTNVAESLSNIGLGTEDSPQFTGIELSHASANTLTASGGTLSIEGAALATAASVALKANLSGGNTIGGAQLLAEGASLQLDAVGSADGAFSGVTRTGTAGATLAFGDLIVLDATDSRWELADANSASGADGDSRGIIGICVQAAAGDGSATTILLSGVVRADAAFPSFTINAPLYVSETAGDITATSPTTEDNVVRILGAAFTADEIHFDPDRVWTVYDAP